MVGTNAFSGFKTGEHIALGISDGMPAGLLSKLAEVLHLNPQIELVVHYMHGSAALRNLVPAAMREQIELRCYFQGGVDRELIKAGVPIRYVPCAFRDVANVMLAAGVRRLLVSGSESPDGTLLGFGTCYGYSPKLARHLDMVVHFEINSKLPYLPGHNLQVMSHGKLFLSRHNAYPALHAFPAATETEKAIAGHILPLIPDGATLQVGVGGVPNIVCAGIKDRGIRLRKIHSELFSPAMIPLLKAGLVSNGVVATIAFGDTPEYYDFLASEEGAYYVRMCGVDYTNNTENMANTGSIVSINSCLEVDYSGQVNSEQIGGKQYSGAGGQLDFVLGALQSPGGMSFLCMPSTRRDKDTREIVSRIVGGLSGCVTVPRNCVDWVVTEKGAVKLRGKSEAERTAALLSIS